jgi:hypothetical protein
MSASMARGPNMESNKTEQNLTEKQSKAIISILEAKSISEGVKKVGISRTTFYEWFKNPVFKTEFARQRNEIIEIALDEMRAATGEAVKVLKGLLGSKNEGIRFRASEAILTHVQKFKELEEIEKRLSEIERTLENEGRT